MIDTSTRIRDDLRRAVAALFHSYGMSCEPGYKPVRGRARLSVTTRRAKAKALAILSWRAHRLRAKGDPVAADAVQYLRGVLADFESAHAADGCDEPLADYVQVADVHLADLAVKRADSQLRGMRDTAKLAMSRASRGMYSRGLAVNLRADYCNEKWARAAVIAQGLDRVAPGIQVPPTKLRDCIALDAAEGGVAHTVPQLKRLLGVRSGG